MQNGADDVKKHRWFKSTNWDELFQKRTKVNVKIIILKTYLLEEKSHKPILNKTLFSLYSLPHG